MKTISSKQISEVGKEILSIKQDAFKNFTEVLPPENAKVTSLVFVSNKNLFLLAQANQCQGYIFTETLWHELQNTIAPTICIWTTKNIQHAMTAILPLFDFKKELYPPGVHATAVVHPTAQVASTAHIGPHVVIEANASIGEHSIIYPHVYIGAYCSIGSRCIIYPNTTIGSDGFGYYSDRSYTHHKIPQIGRVVIEDDCEIGSQCAIDRATLTETKIKKGSKLDNFCHIAHNVEIGENAMITAGFIVAGSTTIGKNLTTAGGVHVTGHVHITDNVILSGRAGVTNNITEPGIYGGFPLEPHKESIRTLSSIPKIKELRKQVKQILKHLNLSVEE